MPTPIAQTPGVLGELVVTGVRTLSPPFPAQESTAFLQITLSEIAMTPGSFAPVAHGDNDRDVVAYERAACFLPFQRVGWESEVRVPAQYGWDWRQTVGFCPVPMWQHSLLAPSMTLNLHSLLSSQRLTS